MTIEITEEYQKVFDILDDKNPLENDPIFVTGGAGVGKSTLIGLIRKRYNNVIVTAPTGIAALNVNGATIHSVFKIPPKFITSFDKRNLKYINVLRNVNILIIDEISMVNANLLDSLEYVLRISTGKDVPFGGVKVVMIGDLYQLPPVVTNETRALFEKSYDTPYFFSAKCLKNVNMKKIKLTKVFRQKDEDFVKLLDNIRKGVDLEDTINYINQNVTITNKSPKDSIFVTTTNNKCDKVNTYFLSKLKGDDHIYEAVVNGTFPLSALPADTMIMLKKDAQVMCLRNQEGAVNGTIGKVKWLNSGSVVITENGTGREIVINKATWEQYGYKAKGENVDSYVKGTFTQIPLKLAWAITVHKSQGQTIPKIHVDMDKGAFASGQLYVALSRCTSLEGISLSRELYLSDVIICGDVKEFYESFD